MAIRGRDLQVLMVGNFIPFVLRKNWNKEDREKISNEIGEIQNYKDSFTLSLFITLCLLFCLLITAIITMLDKGPPTPLDVDVIFFLVPFLTSAYSAYNFIKWNNVMTEFVKDLNRLTEAFDGLHHFFSDPPYGVVYKKMIELAKYHLISEKEEKKCGGKDGVSNTVAFHKKRFVEAWDIAEKFDLHSPEAMQSPWKYYYDIAEKELANMNFAVPSAAPLNI